MYVGVCVWGGESGMCWGVCVGGVGGCVGVYGVWLCVWCVCVVVLIYLLWIDIGELVYVDEYVYEPCRASLGL